MRSWSRVQRREGNKIAFVPTMGALHEGHLSLLREGSDRADNLVLSIYVNPTQFSPGEDLERYPHDLDGDLKRAQELGTGAVFLPTNELMYPDGYNTFVNVDEITARLCGKTRPTHFRGVTTIVAKLFNIVAPDAAIFGLKDYQQFLIIKKMTADLNLPVEIIGCPIVREPDGLAMSSRNIYLTTEQREAAPSLFKSLNAAEEMIKCGDADPAAILKMIRNTIESSEIVKIDYANIVNADTLEDLSKLRRPALIALAAFAGNTRLIDNRLFL